MNSSKFLVVLLVLLQLSGCATNPPQASNHCAPKSVGPRLPDYSASRFVGPNALIKKVALVKLLAPPEIESVDLVYTHEQGAAGGAGSGAFSGLDAWARGAGNSGGFIAAYLLLLPVFMGIGALVGMIAGAHSGHSANKIKEAEANARAELQSAYLQAQLLDDAQDYATDYTDLQFIRMPSADPKMISEKPNYAALSAEGVDTVFELELTRLSLKDLALRMEARARLISVNTGEVLSDGTFKSVSEARPLEDWGTNRAAKLVAAIDNGLKKLSEDVVDENFLLFHPMPPVEKSPKVVPPGPMSITKPVPYDPVPYYVLKPVYPKLEYCFFCEPPLSKRPHRTFGSLKFVKVSSIQPTLRWESFPRPHDLIDVHGHLHQISDVRYDIEVFEAGLANPPWINLVPAEPVYVQRNIPVPYHKIKEPLKPCTDYFWTVRARFKLLGHERVTEWAGAFNAVPALPRKPWVLRRVRNKHKNPHQTFASSFPELDSDWFYYPFRTPCDN